MRRALILALATMVALPAAAADLAGRYHGTGLGQNTILDLAQESGILRGHFQFPDGAQGSLVGRLEAEGASGTISIPGVGQAQFQARTTDGARLWLRIFEQGRVTDAVFLRADAPPGPPQPGQAAAPAAPTSNARFFLEENGVTVGPYTVAQLTEKQQRGELAPDRLVRRSDEQTWRNIGSVPELGGAMPPSAEPLSEAGSPVGEDPLLAAARDIAVAGRPGAPPAALASATGCLMQALDPLTPQDRQQFLFDLRSGPAAAAGQALPGFERALAAVEPRYPGVTGAVVACLQGPG